MGTVCPHSSQRKPSPLSCTRVCISGKCLPLLQSLEPSRHEGSGRFFRLLKIRSHSIFISNYTGERSRQIELRLGSVTSPSRALSFRPRLPADRWTGGFSASFQPDDYLSGDSLQVANAGFCLLSSCHVVVRLLTGDLALEGFHQAPPFLIVLMHLDHWGKYFSFQKAAPSVCVPSSF